MQLNRILNTNITYERDVLHVQTEYLPAQHLLVSNVLVGGKSIYVKRLDCTIHARRATFEERLPSAMQAQQLQVVQRAPKLWEEYKQKQHGLQESRKDARISNLERAENLYYLGVRLHEVCPDAAVLTWQEATTVSPAHHRAKVRLMRATIERKRDGCAR